MALEMKIEKCPTEELSVTNRLVVNKHDFDTIFQKARHVEVGVMNKRYVFSVEPFDRLTPGVLGFSNVQRKFAMVTLGQRVNVRPFQFDLKSQSLVSVTLQVDFFNPRQATQEPYDTDKMAVLFRESFPGIALATNEPLVFRIPDKKMLVMTVTHLEALDVSGKNRPVNIGQLSGNCVITFEKADNSSINLTGKAKGKQSFQSVINPDWNFTQMGIGGLDNEFSGIFRRAFASRVFPPEVVQQIGMKHCRGILLYGPPGTGKTLMARQIGKMLNSREPKIVNGPQILDKYVGESEANIRKLFQEAEDEEKKLGVNSGLHIIIFDEIDAICKARGSVSGSTAVHDTVVNQLLSKIDGVDQLNNILVIGMTNRKDMIDEALLRPGRLEVQMEIGLPNEAGRVQILNIHTTKMRDNDKLAADVDIAELAKETKNFSGAEIEGLVRAAAATAMNRLIKAKSKVEIDPDAVDKLKVTRADFMHSLANDVKPAFGVSLEELEMHVANGIMNWGEEVQHLLREGELLVHQTRTCAETPLVSLIITGSKGSGKTALAAQIARLSEFPFLKICSPKTMIGYHEAAKCQTIKKVFDDAYKSHLSCIVLDDIERLLDYVSIGQRFSNLVLQTLLVLLNNVPPKGHRLLVLGTTSESSILKEMGLYQSFNSHVHVACLNEPHHVSNALRELRAFGEDVIHAIEHKLEQALQSSRNEEFGRTLRIGIKRLLTVVGETKQVPSDQYVYKFITILEEEGYLQ